MRVRLGEFYREAELNFDGGAWLSFALMCGAIFEGILYAKLEINKGFKELIKAAFTDSKITSQTRDIMDMVREYRNLVHSNKYKDPYITRANALDIRTTLDKLIKKT